MKHSQQVKPKIDQKLSRHRKMQSQRLAVSTKSLFHCEQRNQQPTRSTHLCRVVSAVEPLLKVQVREIILVDFQRCFWLILICILEIPSYTITRLFKQKTSFSISRKLASTFRSSTALQHTKQYNCRIISRIIMKSFAAIKPSCLRRCVHDNTYSKLSQWKCNTDQIVISHNVSALRSPIQHPLSNIDA